MRYVIYGDDAMSRRPCEPLVIEADSEDEARGRAVARGIAVRAVMVEPAPLRSDALCLPTDEAPQGEPRQGEPPESAEMRGIRQLLTFVVLPLVITFFLLLAGVRTLIEAVAWSMVWTLGLLLGGGLAGIAGWLSRGRIPAEVGWPIGMVVGLMVLSAGHGAHVGWRWWWAKRSLGPLAQVLGVSPEAADNEEPAGLRMPVMFAQALAGAILGSLAALAGWATGWGILTVLAGTVGGTLGLATEGAILGGVLARRRPMLVPGATAGPSLESLAGLLGRLVGKEHIISSWVLGYALDRAAPGALAGTVTGLLAFLLGWWVVG
jgi:hypothetical protein